MSYCRDCRVRYREPEDEEGEHPCPRCGREPRPTMDPAVCEAECYWWCEIDCVKPGDCTGPEERGEDEGAWIEAQRREREAAAVVSRSVRYALQGLVRGQWHDILIHPTTLANAQKERRVYENAVRFASPNRFAWEDFRVVRRVTEDTLVDGC